MWERDKQQNAAGASLAFLTLTTFVNRPCGQLGTKITQSTAVQLLLLAAQLCV